MANALIERQIASGSLLGLMLGNFAFAEICHRSACAA
jgi:hypothetical protein